MASEQQSPGNFRLQDATIAGIHEAFASGAISCRRLVECYLDRIEAYDRNGPKINSIITVNPHALEDADRLDQVYSSGGQTGVLHGIPVILKDQIDVQGMPTTLGSVVFNDFFPDKDSFVVEKLKNAGAMILAKATLGEMGRGDSHGSLYGLNRQPLRPFPDGGRVLGRIGRQRIRQFRRGGHRPGRFRIHPASFCLERDRGHASHCGPGQPHRGLLGLAKPYRLLGPHDQDSVRPGDPFRCHGRL